MESTPEVKEALAARSQVADLEDLRSEGRKRVKVIRAEQVAEMISDAVRQALSDPRLMTRVEAERLVEAAREAQTARITELTAELERVTQERDEAVAAASSPASSTADAAPAGGVSPEMMLQMMQQFAAMQQQSGGGDGEALSSAIDKLSSNLNERLEKFGRKMGVSSAVETGPVSFDGLFKGDDVQLESNVDSIETKQKKGGGIAANLEKLKKLKGGG